MENMKQKHERSSNYTAYEKNILADLVSKYSSTIEDKRSDGLSLKKRENAWFQLTNEFNNHLDVTSRSVKQIKYYYENMKQTAKQNFSKEKLVRFKTGGGTPNATINDMTSAKILGIIRDQCEPLPNQFDCDAQYNGEIPNENDGDTEGRTVVELTLPVIEPLNETIGLDLEEMEEEVIGPEITEERNEPTTSASSSYVSKKKTGSKKRYSYIEELAVHSTSLCEIEKELLIKNTKKKNLLTSKCSTQK